MKTIISIITVCVLSLFTAKAQTNISQIQTEIVGHWLASETFMPQPPSDMQQDIKAITFETNGIVKWSTVKDGNVQEMIGRYVVSPNDQSPRKLPSIFVAPTKYLNPQVSSIGLLLLTDVTLDMDARFNRDKVGKALKGILRLSQTTERGVVFV